MVKKGNSQRAVQLTFTPEQVKEQKEFMYDLQNGTVDIVFEGSVLEAKAYLAGLKQLVDNHIH